MSVISIRQRSCCMESLPMRWEWRFPRWEIILLKSSAGKIPMDIK